METKKQKKNLGFGFHGWMLILYQALAFFAMTVFTNYPMNILSEMYGGAQKVSTIYTVGCIISIIVQLILSGFIGKIKNVKRISVVLGIITLVLAMFIMRLTPANTGVWQVVYGFEVFFVVTWSTFTLGILIGQWFPRRKGTVMGIATFAFPIANGLIGSFAGRVFAKGFPDPFGAFLPFWIISVIGLILGIIFVTDFPEQCGCYRDNDRSITPEVAKAMMEADIRNKTTSVWTTKNTIRNRDVWFVSVPVGLLLFSCIGLMTQSNAILDIYAAELEPFGGFAGVMLMIAILGVVGSYIFGILDTKFGTKKILILAVIVMIISGAAGFVQNVGCLMVALVCLALFTGASSNFTVSVAAQYWRREDFPNVYSCINPVSNIIQAAGPAVIATILFTKGYNYAFGAIAIVGVICLILMIAFSPKHIKEVDDKYRQAAGKPLDDALVGRK